MKASKKLISGFYLFVLLILFIGLFNLYSMNIFYENNIVKGEINNLIKGLDHSIQEFSLLINTNNLEDYNEIKADIEFERTETEILHKRIDAILHKSSGAEKFDDDIDEFTNISNALIRIQKETLIENNKFIEKAKLEKRLRHVIRDFANEFGDIELVGDSWHMEYESKEMLYQYKDEDHLNEFLESIEQVRDRIKDLDLQDEKKNELLQIVDSYKLIALEMGGVVIKQDEIESEKNLKIQELQKIANKLGEDEREISNKMNSQSKSLARNTYLIIIGITVIGIVLLFVFQRYFIGKIKRKNRK